MSSVEITDGSFDEEDIRALVRLAAATARTGGDAGTLFRETAALLGADFRMRVTAVADGARGVIPTGLDYGARGEDDSAFLPRGREPLRDELIRRATGAETTPAPDAERALIRRFVKGRFVAVTGFFRDAGSPPFGGRERDLAALAFDGIAALSGLYRGASRAATPPPFSGRRLEVVRHLKSGLSSKEIASAMSISTNTVNDHLKVIFKKTGVGTREALLRRLDDEGAAG